MRTTLIAVAITAVFAGGLAAQQSGHCRAVGDSTEQAMRPGGMMHGGMMQGGMMHGGMMQGGMMDGGMMQGEMSMMPAHELVMRAMGFTPQRVKALGDRLDLTEEQLAALDRLGPGRQSSVQDTMAAGAAAGERLAELLEADVPDTAAIRVAALDALRPRWEAYAEMMVVAAAVQGILTPTQRELVAAAWCGVRQEPGG